MVVHSPFTTMNNCVHTYYPNVQAEYGSSSALVWRPIIAGKALALCVWGPAQESGLVKPW